ncbi:Beta-xylosidase [Lactococcus cremoris]|nr:beta-xylosidase [Lactococcus cremoris subsp. cremoris NZ9000]KZK49885.1 Beta-xylosidase [Lactococcus cremoris]
MVKIKNPIIPGMAPDPSIIRVENTYYLATSTFHWMPGIQLYKSTDLVNWTLIDNILKKTKSIYKEQIHLVEFGLLIYHMIQKLKNIG